MNVLQYDAGLALEIAKEFGEKRGRAKMLIENIDTGMQNFHISLQEACEGLGCTVEEYEEAKELVEPKKGGTLFHIDDSDRIRNLCEAREDYRRTWGGMESEVAEMQAKQEAMMSKNSGKESIDEERDKADTERLIEILKLRIVILQRMI